MEPQTKNLFKTPIRDRSCFNSDFTKWMHDTAYRYPQLSRLFLTDLDCITYKRATQTLRVVENKHEQERVSRGQETIFPILADLIAHGRRRGLLSDRSGVYIIRGRYPYDTGFTINPIVGSSVAPTSTLDIEAMIRWMSEE